MFDNIRGGFSYEIFPGAFSTNIFSQPYSRQVFTVTSDTMDLNFIVSRVKYSVSGQVISTDAKEASGVTIKISRDGADPIELTTNSGGGFATNLDGYYRYTITATKNGLTFGPLSYTFDLNRNLPLRFYVGASTSVAVSAATYLSQPIPASGIISLFGTGLSEKALAANGEVTYELDGTSVYFGDEQNIGGRCQLIYVSPLQINFLMPTGVISKKAVFRVIRNEFVASVAVAQISRVTPGIFSANSDGRGPAVGLLLRVRADGSYGYEEIVDYDSALKRYVARPIDFGPESDQLYLELYGTGIRDDDPSVKVKIGDIDVPVLYAGRQSQFIGLDQVNVQLPRSLAGKGEVNIQLTAITYPANTVTIKFK